MLQIGDTVKININTLEIEGLTPESNNTGKDYYSYINTNEDKEYKIIGIVDKHLCPVSPYKLDDEFLKETSFAEKELIKINSGEMD